MPLFELYVNVREGIPREVYSFQRRSASDLSSLATTLLTKDETRWHKHTQTTKMYSISSLIFIGIIGHKIFTNTSALFGCFFSGPWCSISKRPETNARSELLLWSELPLSALRSLCKDCWHAQHRTWLSWHSCHQIRLGFHRRQRMSVISCTNTHRRRVFPSVVTSDVGVAQEMLDSLRAACEQCRNAGTILLVSSRCFLCDDV